MTRDFRRVAIVNRGEAAMRFIHGAREYELEHGLGLTTIALFTEPDRHALFVREADETYDLGPALAVDPKDGQRKSRYLDYAVLERALRETRAEAVWPGWGLVAEHPAFVELCDRMGIVFIGPPAEVMRRLGDKITSKRLAEDAGVPVSPWSGGPVEDLDDARRHAERLGFPLMIKATAGGGGRGIRKVAAMDELEGAFESARSEALKGFGDATVFLEKQVAAARHVEVQLVADGEGGVWALGVRDCSVQRRHQKVMEETPSPALTAEEDRELRAAAARLAVAAGYRNAGTAEFLFDPDGRRFFFLEVNTRLQVEHPVTEMVTGVDLVKLQLDVARGRRIEGEPPPARGCSIELRLNAEDPDQGFAPSPGKVEIFRPARGPGLRVDTGIEEGDEIASEFDSMVAKVIAYGESRAEALARLRRALAQTAVVVRGGATNKAFLQGLLVRPEVVAGEVDVQWLDRMSAGGERLPARHADVAVLQAAVEAYETEVDLERGRFWATAARGRPELGGEAGREVELRYRGEVYEVEVYRIAERTYRLLVDGQRVELEVERLGRSERRLYARGRSHRIITVTHGVDTLVEVDGVPHRVTRDEQGVVRAPAPAVVVSLAVEPGDEVAVGDRLAVLEAMKMETEVRSELNGRVKSVEVRRNLQVAAGAALMVIEPSGEVAVGGSGDRISFAELARGDGGEVGERDLCLHNLDRLAQLFLGWDSQLGEPARMIAQHGIVCRELPAGDPELQRHEERLLEVFVDIASLFRRQPPEEEMEAPDRRTSEEYLFSYLRDPRAEGRGLPEPFLGGLRRALAHYGIEDLEPGPELFESLFRLYKAHRRMGQQVAPVLGILDRRLESAGELAPAASESFHRLLQRLIEETRDRFPAVHDLVREVHYRYVDEPFVGRIRRLAYAEVDRHLERLAVAAGDGGPDAAARRRLVDAVIDVPQPLAGRFVRSFGRGEEAVGEAERRARLEVLLRRLYRVRQLADVETAEHEGRTFVTATYREQPQGLEEEGRTAVVLTQAPWEELEAVAAAADRALRKSSGLRQRGAADLLFHLAAPMPPADELAERARAAVEAAGFPRRAVRVVTSVWSDDGSLHHFTFRAPKKEWEEDRFVRGIHPMLAERLELWRLRNFRVERLRSPDDIYAFHGTSRANPQDERLFVIAEVRDLTPQKDGDGPMRFPHLERMFHESLAVIRRFQSQRTAETRLHWNRVVLYLWPLLELPGDRLRALIRRLAPAVEGLGLQKAVVSGRLPDPRSEQPRPAVIELSQPGGRGVLLRFRESGDRPIEPLSEYQSKVVRLRRRGLVYPYELVRLLAPEEGTDSELPRGEFVEYDLDADGRAVPVEREPGGNEANLVIGVVRNFSAAYPEGMTRVLIASDPTRGMGALAEPECRCILAALDLAARLHVPLEWFAVSGGARISMQSGTENMDWIARVLRRLIEHTQAGGEVNLVVPGINVGAQPYWNAEATMLMHTRGILIMTPQGAMVLTGKDALDYSGGVSAEDNQGIGGYERIMGPNGQAQYFARDVNEACRILLAYYERSYAAPGERFPRRRQSRDATQRDVRAAPHGDGFERVGEVFSDEANAGRKKPFNIRRVMAAVVDEDREPLERWFGMEDAEIGVVWDAFLGGHPVSVLGFESQPLPRLGFHPADGPDQWTSGTLFPQSSKKIARAINAASGSRPLVILANLSGFDGSPESMRKWQLEYGAEIGRAVVNFRGPIVFCVVSRYHGGAFVVFSNALNDNLQVAALEGSYASVIGGAPAAAVVFAREVTQRARADERVTALQEQISGADPAARAKLRTRLDELLEEVRSEKLGEVAAEFDRIHSIERAREVGSVHAIIAPERLRPWLVEAIEQGMRREEERWQQAGGGTGFEEAPDLQGRKGRKRRARLRKAAKARGKGK
jgi:acetyl/propionyl-CoA carboxylase alpha subunit/acetyl-CoA carboxylase carboxyltransferase component